MGILAYFPKSWKVDAIVLRSGGRDARGNPQPDVEISRPGVLVAPRSTADPVDRSDVGDNTAVLYDDGTAFTYQSTDKVRIPEGARMAGLWSVEGRPGEWPLGTEVGLMRA